MLPMPTAAQSQPIPCLSIALPSVDTELLVVPWFEDERRDSLVGLNQAVGGEITRAVSSKEFAAKPFDIFITPIVDRAWKARRVMAVGAGPEAAFTADLARKIAMAAALAARRCRVFDLAFVVRPGLPAPR